jgi:hypothetical protein
MYGRYCYCCREEAQLGFAGTRPWQSKLKRVSDYRKIGTVTKKTNN